MFTAALRSAAQTGVPETVEIGGDGSRKLKLGAHCLALVEVR
jgi:hypothetical protein